MISNVYNYYFSQYGSKSDVKYDSHTRDELKNSYGKMLKLNSQAPTYKRDTSNDALEYAIDLKENARMLSNVSNDLLEDKDGNIPVTRTALSSDPDAIEVELINTDSLQLPSSLEIKVKQLATNQINVSTPIDPNEHSLAPGNYNFDLSINDITYEFQFMIDKSENNKEVQEKISRLINRSNLGLHSKLKNNAQGNSYIEIASETTGLNSLKSTIFNISASAIANSEFKAIKQDPITGAISKDTDKEMMAADLYNKSLNNSRTIVTSLGLNKISQYPSNAIFTINDIEQTSSQNEFVINGSFSVNLKSTTDKAVNISIQEDSNSVFDTISNLINSYNNLIDLIDNVDEKRFTNTPKLKMDISNLAKKQRERLFENGLNVADNGKISIDKNKIIQLVNNDKASDIFKSIKNFKNSVQKKAEDISLNPMNYVNNTLFTYKNPNQHLSNPYNPSDYSGMMYDGTL